MKTRGHWRPQEPDIQLVFFFFGYRLKSFFSYVIPIGSLDNFVTLWGYEAMY
jgi:hypothetical protein